MNCREDVAKTLGGFPSLRTRREGKEKRAARWGDAL